MQRIDGTISATKLLSFNNQPSQPSFTQQHYQTINQTFANTRACCLPCKLRGCLLVCSPCAMAVVVSVCIFVASLCHSCRFPRPWVFVCVCARACGCAHVCLCVCGCVLFSFVGCLWFVFFLSGCWSLVVGFWFLFFSCLSLVYLVSCCAFSAFFGSFDFGV